MTPEEQISIFYKHLDECEECREHFSALCKKGNQLLKQAIDAVFQGEEQQNEQTNN